MGRFCAFKHLNKTDVDRFHYQKVKIFRPTGGCVGGAMSPGNSTDASTLCGTYIHRQQVNAQCSRHLFVPTMATETTTLSFGWVLLLKWDQTEDYRRSLGMAYMGICDVSMNATGWYVSALVNIEIAI